MSGRMLLIPVAFSVALGVSAANAQKMYWMNGPNEIRRANLDASDIEVVITDLVGGFAIALDVGGGKIYWTDIATDKIQRANLDGTNVEDLLTGVESFGIALDVGGGKIYWTDVATDKIQRANLDGSGVEDLITTGLVGAEGIALDLEASKMYWTDTWGLRIQRANLDGSNVEDLVVISDNQLWPVGIALHVPAGKMYWTLADVPWGEVPGKIQRANLDGSAIEDLVVTGAFEDVPDQIALDLGRGKMYWGDRSSIRRANLDGSGVEDVAQTSNPGGIALDLRPPEIPALSEGAMLAMAFLLLAAGALVIAQRRPSRHSRA